MGSKSSQITISTSLYVCQLLSPLSFLRLPPIPEGKSQTVTKKVIMSVLNGYKNTLEFTITGVLGAGPGSQSQSFLDQKVLLTKVVNL